MGDKILILVLMFANLVLLMLYIRTVMKNIELKQQSAKNDFRSEFKKHLEEEESLQKK